MMSKEIRIVVAEPGKLPTVSFITDSLKGMQQIVVNLRLMLSGVLGQSGLLLLRLHGGPAGAIGGTMGLRL